MTGYLCTYSRAPLGATILFAIFTVFVVSLPNLVDPLVRFDDFPALLAEPEGFYWKTLYEGRWLNYWWHLRDVVTPAWLNFALYQGIWAVFAAAAAVNALGRDAPGWNVAALALTILVAPPALLIAPWFNTLLPGLAVVALYALMSIRLGPRTLRLWLPVFVPVTLMAYTTYPMLLLALCLTQHGVARSWRDLLSLLVLFAASFALGLALVYGLNYLEHGVFGIPMAEWRAPSPAHDLHSALANLPVLAESAALFVHKIGFGFLPATLFHAALLIAATIVLAIRSPRAALYIWAGLATGTALLTLQVLKTGVVVPVRATAFLWLFYAILLIRAAMSVAATGPGAARLARNLVFLVTASYLLQTAIQYSAARAWQADTRALATEAGAAAAPILIYGDYRGIASADAAGIQNASALAYRLRYLTGRRTILCDSDPARCPPRPVAQTFSGNAVVLQAPDGTMILLPDRVPTD